MKIKFLISLIFLVLNAEECSYTYLTKEKNTNTIAFSVDDEFGCGYENRNITQYENNIRLSFKTNSNTDRVFKYYKSNKPIVFDILSYSAPETEKVRDVSYIKEKNLLAILHGFNIFLEDGPDNIIEDNAFYHISIYKLFNNFLLKIILDEKSLTGQEGFSNQKYVQYEYKKHDKFYKKIDNLMITNKVILTSLETFLKPDYAEKYESKFTFKDSSFDIETLKAILDDIPITLNTLTSYNNIAYYLEKAEAYEESAYLLEKILEKFPNRTVAHYNLGDAYWGLGEKDKAIASYQTYIQQMKANGKEKRIPQLVLDRVNNSK